MSVQILFYEVKLLPILLYFETICYPFIYRHFCFFIYNAYKIFYLDHFHLITALFVINPGNNTISLRILWTIITPDIKYVSN